MKVSELNASINGRFMNLRGIYLVQGEQGNISVIISFPWNRDKVTLNSEHKIFLERRMCRCRVNNQKPPQFPAIIVSLSLHAAPFISAQEECTVRTRYTFKLIHDRTSWNALWHARLQHRD